MQTILKVEGMSCGHCVKAVTSALEELPGVTSAQVSLEGKTATVEHNEKVSLDQMKSAIEEAGYEVV
jgi:copper ion binding protein